MNDSFVFYRSFFEAIKDEPDDVISACVKALCDYALYGEEPDLDSSTRIFFILAKAQIDANNRRREDGKKGGAPKGNQNAKKEKPLTVESENNQNNHRLIEKQPNVNANANVNANVNANANANVNANANDAPAPAQAQEPPIANKTQDCQNVHLTELDLLQLMHDFGEAKTLQYVRRLDDYIGRHGDRYGSHSATIRKWIEEDIRNPNRAKQKKQVSGPGGKYAHLEQKLLEAQEKGGGAE